MSFEKFMSDWAKGKRALDNKNIFYEIRPSSDSLEECEVLSRGEEAIDDVSLTRDHISWLRDSDNNFRCCYSIDNAFREFNFKQLDMLFGDDIRNGGLQNNSQVLSNGISVPIVPQNFIEEITQRHEQKKRRVLYAQRIKKKNLPDINNMLLFFNMNCAPTTEECHESIHIIPPHLLRSMKTKQEDNQNYDVRERTIKILETTRNKIINHPVYNRHLQTNIFDNVHNVSDFLKLSVQDDNGNKINIAQQLVGLYHVLYPVSNQ